MRLFATFTLPIRNQSRTLPWCAARKRSFFDPTPPPLNNEHVVEVAVSSPALDRDDASLYAEAGGKEYWIILGTERRVEVYRRPENGRHQETRVFEARDTIECSSIPSLRIAVSDLFG